MAYRRNFRRSAAPQRRVIIARFASQCACCGATINAGETVDYFPAGTIAGIDRARVAHVGGLDGNSSVCYAVIKRQMERYGVSSPAELPPLQQRRGDDNAYAGDGLDMRYEDDCRDVCGL